MFEYLDIWSMGLYLYSCSSPSNVRGRPADKNKPYFILIFIKEKGDVFLLFFFFAFCLVIDVEILSWHWWIPEMQSCSCWRGDIHRDRGQGATSIFILSPPSLLFVLPLLPPSRIQWLHKQLIPAKNGPRLLPGLLFRRVKASGILSYDILSTMG